MVYRSVFRRLLALVTVSLMMGFVTVPSAEAAEPTSFQELIQDPTLHRGHSEVLRLYFAVLGRTPEVEGAQFWLNAYDSGDWSTRRIASFFAESAEFEATYGASLSNADFVRVVYENVLNRAADQEGFDFWVAQVDAGMSRGEMVLLVSNAPEFINRVPLPGDTRASTGPVKRTTPIVISFFDSVSRYNNASPNKALAAPNSPAYHFASYFEVADRFARDNGFFIVTTSSRTITNTTIEYDNDLLFDNIRLEQGKVADFTFDGQYMSDSVGTGGASVTTGALTLSRVAGFSDDADMAVTYWITNNGTTSVTVLADSAQWTIPSGGAFFPFTATGETTLAPGATMSFVAAYDGVSDGPGFQPGELFIPVTGNTVGNGLSITVS